MMKFVLLHTNADYLTGLRFSLLRYLVALGAEVVACAPNLEVAHSEKLAQSGIRGGSYSIHATGMNPVSDLASMFGMWRLLRREKPEVILTNNAKPVIWGTLAAALAGVRGRYCLVGGLGYAFVDDAAAATLKRRWAKWVMSFLYKLSFRFATAVIFQNRDDRDELVCAGICAADKARVVSGSGVETDIYSPATQPVDEPVFVMVGRLIAEKGVGDYLSAATMVKEQYASARFILLGASDNNPSAVRTDELNVLVDRGVVEWPGAVRNVAEWLRRASVFVLPSYYREGIPRSALEAMASGLPIITTDSYGCRETVRDGSNGILVPVRSPAELANAMRTLCADASLRRAMGANSRRYAMERFDARIVNQEMAQIMGFVERNVS